MYGVKLVEWTCQNHQPIDFPMCVPVGVHVCVKGGNWYCSKYPFDTRSTSRTPQAVARGASLPRPSRPAPSLTSVFTFDPLPQGSLPGSLCSSPDLPCQSLPTTFLRWFSPRPPHYSDLSDFSTHSKIKENGGGGWTHSIPVTQHTK